MDYMYLHGVILTQTSSLDFHIRPPAAEGAGRPKVTPLKRGRDGGQAFLPLSVLATISRSLGRPLACKLGSLSSCFVNRGSQLQKARMAVMLSTSEPHPDRGEPSLLKLVRKALSYLG